MAFDPSTNYLDIWNIFAHVFVGDVVLAILIGIAIIAFVSLKNQVGWQMTILFEVTWVLIVAAISANMSFWAWAVLIIAGISYFLINKTINRGG